jgi:hypothetical protein
VCFAVPRSQCSGYLTEVRRLIWIESAPARRRLDRRIRGDQHCHSIADRMIIANPRQGASRPSGRKDRLARRTEWTMR